MPLRYDAAAARNTAQSGAESTADAGKRGFFSRLRRGLGRTSENLVQGMGTLFLGRKEIDEDLLRNWNRAC